jgi:hypothetical protein
VRFASTGLCSNRTGLPLTRSVSSPSRPEQKRGNRFPIDSWMPAVPRYDGNVHHNERGKADALIPAGHVQCKAIPIVPQKKGKAQQVPWGEYPKRAERVVIHACRLLGSAPVGYPRLGRRLVVGQVTVKAYKRTRLMERDRWSPARWKSRYTGGHGGRGGASGCSALASRVEKRRRRPRFPTMDVRRSLWRV